MSGLAGEIEARDAWKILEQDDGAVLIDVRTDAEWTYVGVPDLSPLGKTPVRLSWQLFPEMAVDPGFCDKLESLGLPRDAPLLFICRSGARSRAAAEAMAARGYTRCYNVVDGFEGDPDAHNHRGTINGWKVAGLPWVQE